MVYEVYVVQPSKHVCRIRNAYAVNGLMIVTIMHYYVSHGEQHINVVAIDITS